MRNSAKALIVRDGKILLNRCTSRFGPYYALPGGGQEIGETLPDALVREVAEETGYDIRPERMCGIYEIVQNQCGNCVNHKIYFYFTCRMLSNACTEPTVTDQFQTGSEWVELDKLGETCLFPQAVREAIPAMLSGEKELIYIGSDRKG